MFRSADAMRIFATCFLLSVALSATATDKFPGIGRAATSTEIAAWDIDVRPDFKGLPTGSGSANKGQEIWDARCANCHGTFAESNEVFTPIVGGTTADDIKRGRVASLTDSKQPQRTTMMKVATLSSLFDYIYRAMPWNAPRSLSADDTYAVLAYLLSLSEIVPDNFTLSDQNIREVQNKMPNRFGMSNAHGLWNARGVPDIKASACMNNCVQFVQIGSRLPDYARNAHNNLAEQNRPWGPFRGADTSVPPLTALAKSDTGETGNSQSTALRLCSGSAVQSRHCTDSVSPAPTGDLIASPSSAKNLFNKHHCSACHRPDNKLIGPALRDIAKRYIGKPEAVAMLQEKVRNGGAGAWGNLAMPAHDTIAKSDIASLVSWILEGKF